MDRTDKRFTITTKCKPNYQSLLKEKSLQLGIVSVSANPTEGEITFKVSLVSIVGSRPVRVINGDPVSEFPHFLNFQF